MSTFEHREADLWERPLSTEGADRLAEFASPVFRVARTGADFGMAEAWLGVTRNAALAVGRPERGHLATGAVGDLVIWNSEDHRELVQHLGAARSTATIVAGQLIHMPAGA